MKNIAFIGGGNLANALISGMVSSGNFEPDTIKVADPSEKKLESIRADYKVRVTQDNMRAVAFADVIILTIKPSVYRAVIEQIAPVFDASKLLVTVAAGITTDYVENIFGRPLSIIRTMPNIPASVHTGMTALSPNRHASEVDINVALELFNCVGQAEIITENLMDVVTAISGSSPAIVYMFIEALADGAVLKGMNREQAYRFVSQAVMGSAQMVRDLEIHPGQLKDHVSSAGGTSIEAVYSLEKNGFRGIIIEAIEKCANKARYLSEQLK